MSGTGQSDRKTLEFFWPTSAGGQIAMVLWLVVAAMATAALSVKGSEGEGLAVGMGAMFDGFLSAFFWYWLIIGGRALTLAMLRSPASIGRPVTGRQQHGMVRRANSLPPTPPEPGPTAGTYDEIRLAGDPPLEPSEAVEEGTASASEPVRTQHQVPDRPSCSVTEIRALVARPSLEASERAAQLAQRAVRWATNDELRLAQARISDYLVHHRGWIEEHPQAAASLHVIQQVLIHGEVINDQLSRRGETRSAADQFRQVLAILGSGTTPRVSKIERASGLSANWRKDSEQPK